MPDLKAIQHYCAYQERCHSEVRNKLLELSFRGSELEEAIASLIADNFLNEERFARAYVRGKFNINRWGRVKIVQGLKLRKVSDYCIKKGLLEINEDDYAEALRALIEKKLLELRGEKHPGIRKQKVLRYLVQRGFEQHLILDALNTE